MPRKPSPKLDESSDLEAQLEGPDPAPKDFVDFVAENQEGIKNNLSSTAQHMKNVWNTIPDMVSGILGNFWAVLQKIWMKMRSVMLFQLTNDLNQLDLGKSLWDRCEMLTLIRESDTKSQFDTMIVRIWKKTGSNLQLQNELRRVRGLIKRGQREHFLVYYVEHQTQPTFIWVRDQLQEEVHLNLNPPAPESEAPTLDSQTSRKTITIQKINTQLEDLMH